MSFASLISRLERDAARFRSANGGNIAVIFAIALLPLLGFVGAAVDYSRASRARTAIQTALDSTALMVAKDLTSGKIDASSVQSAANTYFKGLYNNTEAANIAVTAAYTPKTSSENAKLTVNGTGSVTTEFMKVMNIATMNVGASSTTTWGGTRLRVALALDVTGSMVNYGSTKLAELKTAAKKLIDTLKQSATSTDDVYVSIVPFDVYVNVGTGNSSASWLSFNWDGYGTCSPIYSSWWSSENEKDFNTKTTCQKAGKTWTASKKSQWGGCVTDRNQDFDTTKDAPTSSNSGTLFPATNDTPCPKALLPLKSVYDSAGTDGSTDPNTLKGKINSLTGAGNTNQAIGLQWAWLSLQSTAPLNAPTKDPQYKYTDAIILMSDGLNTEDRWYNSASAIDARETKLCNNIKQGKTKDGPETLLYTIQVNTDGDPESAVLKACGQDSGGFFSTTTAAGINDIFSQVGASLTKLRISK
ncbi:MAG: pilus assembly protein TadG-related protein [Rhodopseudomonas sp.]